MASLYIHIPFCARKCFYCSFVVSVGQKHRIDAYLDCLSKEASGYEGYHFTSVYIGGGTPGYLDPDQLKRLFGIIRRYFVIKEDVEYTVELNPESVDEGKLSFIYDAGITRVSLGIQSLDDHYLKYSGRNHNAQKAREAYTMIRAAGFKNVNVDLMISFPEQTLDQINQDMREIINLDSEHISLYMLNLEENSRFYSQKVRLADDDTQAKQYLMVVAELERFGYKQYEISNFAKPMKESRHNLNYWQGGEYVGLGVGAHSYLNGRLFWNVSRLNGYIERIQELGSAVDNFTRLDAHSRLKQAVLIGLRMNKGVEVGHLEQSIGSCLTEQERQEIQRFIHYGFFIKENGHLKTTDKGRLVLDELCVQLS